MELNRCSALENEVRAGKGEVKAAMGDRGGRKGGDWMESVAGKGKHGEMAEMEGGRE